MMPLISLLQNAPQGNDDKPYAIYQSFQEQRLLNVPIEKPLLIIVLKGLKKLGAKEDIICPSHSFIFLANSPVIDMRNIPNDEEYLALLIEFDFEDFDHLPPTPSHTVTSITGNLDKSLEFLLAQFVQWSHCAPFKQWRFRKREILQLLFDAGYTKLGAIATAPSLSHQVHTHIKHNMSDELSNEQLSQACFMSESTLRRKLNREGTSIQGIKDRTKLGHGLHLIQTTHGPIATIAQQCGYSSQSRFTERFKQLFGITPTALRKTRKLDKGENLTP